MQDELDGAYLMNKKMLVELVVIKRALEDSKKVMDLHISTTNLDHLLSVGRNGKETRGLGYVEASTSTSDPCAPKFVKAALPINDEVEIIADLKPK